MEALSLEAPDLYHPERGEKRDEYRLVDQVDKERVPPERDERPRDLRHPSRDASRPLATPVQDVAGEEAEQDHPEPGEQGPVVRHEQILRHDAQREQPRALRGDLLRLNVPPCGYKAEAQEQVREPVPQQGVCEDYGDPDQVQDAERDDP